MIVLAHNCSILRVPFDSARLFKEPYSDYALALSMVVEAVSTTNRREKEKAERNA